MAFPLHVTTPATHVNRSFTCIFSLNRTICRENFVTLQRHKCKKKDINEYEN